MIILFWQKCLGKIQIKNCQLNIHILGSASYQIYTGLHIIDCILNINLTPYAEYEIKESYIPAVAKRLRKRIKKYKHKELIMAETYKSGKIEASDSTPQEVVLKGSEYVCLHSKQLDWQIKILTVKDKINGKTYDDVDIIYLDEGQTIDDLLNVYSIQFTCPNASGTTNGILYYYSSK